jgi:hypothetical protein
VLKKYFHIVIIGLFSILIFRIVNCFKTSEKVFFYIFFYFINVGVNAEEYVILDMSYRG